MVTPGRQAATGTAARRCAVTAGTRWQRRQRRQQWNDGRRGAVILDGAAGHDRHGRRGGTGTAGTTGAAGTTGGRGPVNLNGRKALLVVDNPGSLDDGETILKLTLENKGMTVTLAPGTGPATLATGQNVVLVSSGVGSGDFVPVFKDVAVPMIVFGNSAYQNLGWITSSSGQRDRQQHDAGVAGRRRTARSSPI